jgi:hypothetical protein
MLHAMFELYECRCENGCKQKQEAWRLLGDKGHHDPWLKAALMIEVESREALGWQRMDLHQYVSMAFEMSEGRKLPNKEALKSLYLHKSKLRKPLKRRYKKIAAMPSINHPDSPDNESMKWLKSNRCILQDRIIET